MHEASEQTVVAVCRQALGNKDGDDERVDCEDARHDDGDEGLHDQVRPEYTNTSDTDARFGCTKSCANASEDHSGCNTGHAKEGRKLWRELRAARERFDGHAGGCASGTNSIWERGRKRPDGCEAGLARVTMATALAGMASSSGEMW